MCEHGKHIAQQVWALFTKRLRTQGFHLLIWAILGGGGVAGAQGPDPSMRLDGDSVATISWTSATAPNVESLVLRNAGSDTITFRLAYNGGLAASQDELANVIAAMPEQFPGESLPRKLWRYVIDHKYNFVPLTHKSWIHDPVLFFNSLGYGYCRDYAFLTSRIASHLGLVSRVYGFPAHSVPELSVDGKWVMYDPTYSSYYFDDSGEIAGIEGLNADTSLVTSPRIRLDATNTMAYDPVNAANFLHPEVISEEPPASSDQLRFLLPPNGSLQLPGVFELEVHGTFSTSYAPSHANARIIVPAGSKGTVDAPLVLHTIKGAGWVRVDSQRLRIGSPELISLIRSRDTYVHRVEVDSAESEVQVIYLLNPRAFPIGGNNLVEVRGAKLDSLDAALVPLAVGERLRVGRLAVNINGSSPSDVQWSVDGMQWLESGETLWVSAGRDLKEWALSTEGMARTVRFRSLSQKPRPADTSVVVAIDETAVLSVQSRWPNGSFVRLNILPAELGAAGELATIDGNAVQPGLFNRISTGKGELRFATVPGYFSPENQTLTIQEGIPTVVDALYWKSSPPVLADMPPDITREDLVYSRMVSVSDPDTGLHEDRLTFSLTPADSWLDIDSITGNLSGTPNVSNFKDTLFSLRVTDRTGLTASEELRIHIRHVNHPPSIVAPGPQVVVEGVALSIRCESVDIDSLVGDKLQFVLVNNPAWLSIDPSAGVISGTPLGSDVGETTCEIMVTDDSGATASVSLPVTVKHVNHAPVFGAITRGGAIEDRFFTISLHASDQDSALFHDRVQYSLRPVSSWLNIDPATGVASGLPGIRHLADSLFTVVAIDDSGATDTLELTIRVHHMNHAPAFAGIPPVETTEDYRFTACVGASDPDTLVGDRLHYRMIFGPGWLTVDSLTGHASGTPGAGDVGSGSMTIIVHDDSGASATLVLPFTVRHTNHAPTVSLPAALAAIEDSLFTARIEAADVDAAQFGDTLRFTAILKPDWLTLDPLTGSLSGTPRAGQLSEATLAVLVTDGKGGSSAVTTTITVSHTNHAPVFAITPGKNSGAVEDTPFTLNCAATDSDSHAFGDSLTYSLTTRPHWLSFDSATGIVSGTPGEEDHDTTFTVQVSDGAAVATLTVALPVEQVNDPPVFTGQLSLTLTEDSSAMIELLPFVQDPDDEHETLQWGLEPSIEGADLHFCSAPPDDSPSFHTDDDSLAIFLDTTAARIYVQARKNFTGTGLPLVISMNDPDGLRAVDTLRVSITPVNDPPVLARFADIVVAEDDSVVLTRDILNTRVSDPDDPDSLLVWQVAGYPTLDPAWTTSGIRIHPAVNWSGHDSITVAVVDRSGLRDSLRVAVHVIPVNDPPEVATLPDLIVRGDSVVTFSLARFIADVDDSTASLRAFISPLEPSASDPPDVASGKHGKTLPVGSLHFAVDSAMNVTITATGQTRRSTLPLLVRAFDPQGGVGYDTLFLTVVPPPLAPVIQAIADTAVIPGQPFSLRVRAHVTGDDPVGLTYCVEGPAWLSIDSSGVLSGTPPRASDDSVLVIVMSTDGGADSLRFRITVRGAAVPDVPADYVLFQNYPNPFNPATTIRFGLPEASRVSAEVFNILGQRVASIVSSDLPAGYHTVEWSPVGLASGAYIIVLEVHGLVSSGRDARMIKKASLIR